MIFFGFICNLTNINNTFKNCFGIYDISKNKRLNRTSLCVNSNQQKMRVNGPLAPNLFFFILNDYCSKT